MFCWHSLPGVQGWLREGTQGRLAAWLTMWFLTVTIPGECTLLFDLESISHTSHLLTSAPSEWVQ